MPKKKPKPPKPARIATTPEREPDDFRALYFASRWRRARAYTGGPTVALPPMGWEK